MRGGTAYHEKETVMRRTAKRFLIVAAAVIVLLLAIAGAAAYWSEFGPGLDREVARLAALLELRPGMTVAEIGAGKGRMAVRMARRLGPSGRLYATEIDAGKLQAIRNAARRSGLDNITVVEGGERSTGLPAACCDVIYMRRVYHHFTDAAAMGKALHAALRPRGRLVVLDFLFTGWRIFPSHGVASESVVRELTQAGFTPERSIPRWSPIGYCAVFRASPTWE